MIQAMLLPAAAASALLLVHTHAPRAARAQAADTATPGLLAGSAYITNTFEGEPAINVRVGPSTIIYPVPCGSLAYGASAAALGTTPAHEWVQIEHPTCPGGVGWVYAANVTVTGALREVEPPFTPTPLATATFDPTLVAAFQAEPTVTRLPTFTPPAPLSVPTFAALPPPRRGVPAGAAILAVALVGGLVLAVSFLGRR
jgi:hypothetical protein